MRSRSENDVSTTTTASGSSERTRLIASMPSTLGIERSISTTSGLCSRHISTASAPSAAVPTTSRSPAVASSWDTPVRTTAWSSARRIRITTPPEGGSPRSRACGRRGAGFRGRSWGRRHLEAERRAAGGAPGELELPAGVTREIAHHAQAEVALAGDGVAGALAVVVDDERDAPVVAVDRDLDGPGVGVLDHVAQSLLRGTVEHALGILREAHRGIGLQVDLHPACGQRREQVRLRGREPLAVQARRAAAHEPRAH